MSVSAADVPGVGLVLAPVTLDAPSGPVMIGAGHQKVVPATGLDRIILAERPLQKVWADGVAIPVAVGFTVMVKLLVGPSQVVPPFEKCGVTVMVAVTGALVALVAVNEPMLPVPLAARLMDGVSLTQV